MSKPPASFQREPGASTPIAPCGWSWFKSQKVTGEIPKTGGFGKQYETVLDPLVKQSDLPSSWGRSTQAEDTTIDKITNRIAITDHWVDQGLGDGWLKAKEAASIRWLLSHAEAHIEAVDDIYDRWKHREAVGVQKSKSTMFGPGSAGGAWPLSDGDSIEDFAGGVCKGKDYNEIVELTGHGGGVWVRCPKKSEMDQRPLDRNAIKNHVMDAIYNVRCAEWGVWRLQLYREALEAYRVQHGIDDYQETPKGPTPIPGMGGFQAGDVGPGAGAPGGLAAPYIPPETPDDLVLPDPADLPPPDDLGPEPQRVGGSEPKRVSGPQRVGPTHPDATAPPSPASDAASVVLPAAALAALGWLLLS